MRFRHEVTYSASPDAVAEMLVDPAFYEEVLTSLDVLDHSVQVSSQGGAAVVDLVQVQATTGLPSFATKFVGDRIEIHERRTFAAATGGTLSLTVPGKPGQLTGTLTLDAVDGSTRQRIGGDLTVSIPFLGGKLEEMIAGLYVFALDAEGRVGADWLRR